MPSAELVDLATRTFVYGYPLTYNIHEIGMIPSGESTIGAGKAIPYNTFGHLHELATPATKFVSPNNDTLYMIAPLAMRGGPVELHVPDTGGRYYVLQLVDMWTNNFAYIGRRATGTQAGRYLLTPAGYDGAVPAGVTAVPVPSDVAIIVGRLQIDATSELPELMALQERFTLTAPATGAGAGDPLPSVGPDVPADLAGWELLRLALAAFPPPEGDAPFLDDAGELGLLDATSPFTRADPDLAAALVEGEAKGRALIEQLITGGATGPTGWSSAMHMFDYNLDRCGLGTIDDPTWKIADRTTAYATRAAAARAGLWGNHGYEAAYHMVRVDGDGEVLDGRHDYEVTFPTAPQAKAFWSFTMYDSPDFYLVANPIDRYAIGDRTPGLQHGEDGSITLYLRRTSPGPDKEPNWLPTPAGAFRPLLRTYEPYGAILDGTYELPPIRRV